MRALIGNQVRGGLLRGWAPQSIRPSRCLRSLRVFSHHQTATALIYEALAFARNHLSHARSAEDFLLLPDGRPRHDSRVDDKTC